MKNPLRWKLLDEQNSEHFSECRSVLFLRSRHILIVSDIIEILYFSKRIDEQNSDRIQ